MPSIHQTVTDNRLLWYKKNISWFRRQHPFDLTNVFFFFLNAGPQVISINIVWGILTWSYFALPHPTPKQNCHICCEHSNFCVLNEDSGTSILYRCAGLVVILILIGDKQILNVVEFSVETCQCLQTHAQSFWKLSTNFASHPVGKIGKVGKRVEFLYMFGLENVET